MKECFFVAHDHSATDPPFRPGGLHRSVPSYKIPILGVLFRFEDFAQEPVIEPGFVNPLAFFAGEWSLLHGRSIAL